MPILSADTSPQTPILYSPSRRLMITTPTPEHDAQTTILRTDPTARRYLPSHLPEAMTIDEARERRESRAKDPSILDLNVLVQQEVDGPYIELAGSLGISKIYKYQRSCEIGILVATKYHGQGFASEIFFTVWTYLFEELKLHRVSLETAMANAPMRGWLEKVAGVVQEGMRRECWTDNEGGWIDVASYAVLDWEWRERVKGRLEARIGLENSK
ncbi:hypothetical protein D9611_014560 [Ephemerocybe angulata]|uniref:N-acetyltransferase domain-containing protein n=1 Tax=Ephemerocybe angulata TaxID=980116 RepID=A0A8H5CCC3_9AGAR|nr:hypothetical protein D9611_014560 [Tulosesus angulatus]